MNHISISALHFFLELAPSSEKVSFAEWLWLTKERFAIDRFVHHDHDFLFVAVAKRRA